MSLSVADFTRVVKYPKAAIIALVCQMFFLPVCAFFIAIIFNLKPDYAVGLMIIAAAPGGSSASLLSHLFKGDVALNISLTAVNSVLALFTMPLIVKFAVLYFFGNATDISLPLDKVAQVFTLVIVPAAIGMVIKNYFPALTLKTEKPLRYGSIAIVALLIGFIAYSLGNRLDNYADLPVIIAAAATFNIISLLFGYFLPQVFDVSPKQATAISMEIGIHNTTLSLFVAFTAMQMPYMAILPAIYGLIMFFTAAGFGYLIRHNNSDEVES
ncbi:MAG: bile acid:sodium symporter [Sphingobacteriales bacterium JAD_PAG50586_3]|nr:MAG: bile acid:sodium symporter [Sphingobacteriales bacterium JAD_PAG50586_3]